MGYGGVATAAVDMLAALTVLPALLAVLGRRVNALWVRGAVRRPPVAETSGGWYRLATAVMRRPLLFLSATVAVLLVLGAPFLHVAWGRSSLNILPAGAQPRVVSQVLSRDFPGQQNSPIEAVVQFPGPAAGLADRGGQLAAYADRLAHVPGVQGTQLTGVRGGVALVELRYAADPMSSRARRIVRLARAVAPPAGARAYVGGRTAELADTLTALAGVLPWMALAMATATFVLLFLAFGSVVLPVKAITMNVVSLSAAFGVVTWIFQDGHLSGLLAFTPLRTIEPTTPILMFAIIFGLSMDYEVFLLSRIRERYDATGDNTAAVAGGLQRTGGVITSAALLLIIVVGTFSISGVTTIKLLGVGMVVALAVDATIVRVLLVPATMRLVGRANWWAPAFSRPLYARHVRGGGQPRPPLSPAGTSGQGEGGAADDGQD
jgi:RND superfamily putative drug exporter